MVSALTVNITYITTVILIIEMVYKRLLLLMRHKNCYGNNVGDSNGAYLYAFTVLWWYSKHNLCITRA